MIALLSDVAPKNLTNEVVFKQIHYLHLPVSISGILEHSFDCYDVSVSLELALEHFTKGALPYLL